MTKTDSRLKSNSDSEFYIRLTVENKALEYINGYSDNHKRKGSYECGLFSLNCQTNCYFYGEESISFNAETISDTFDIPFMTALHMTKVINMLFNHTMGNFIKCRIDILTTTDDTLHYAIDVDSEI